MQVEGSGKQVAKELESAGMTMKQTIAKLFNVPASSSVTKKRKFVSKSSGEKDVTKKAGKPVVTEVVCMPIGASTISKGPVRTAFKKSGYIANVTYHKMDSELIIRDKIHHLFPKIVTTSKAMVQFHFLKIDGKCSHKRKSAI